MITARAFLRCKNQKALVEFEPAPYIAAFLSQMCVNIGVKSLVHLFTMIVTLTFDLSTPKPHHF